MVLVEENMDEGHGARLYRTTGEIQDDIVKITARIRQASARLRIHDLIVAAVAENRDPARLIPALAGIVEDAEATLAELTEWRDTLSLLRDEMAEVCFLTGR